MNTDELELIGEGKTKKIFALKRDNDKVMWRDNDKVMRRDSMN